MLEELKRQVWQANVELIRAGLVALTWGNASGISRNEGLVVIKPSGVEYETLVPEEMPVVDLEGRIVEGAARPSSDMQTHLELYKGFPKIGGVVHTHSLHAVMFAQAMKEIPCLGTTHADHFFGAIPVTRLLSEREVEEAYEKNTGKVIVRRFRGLDPHAMPAVLVAGHAPFCWGDDVRDAVHNAIALENIAVMAMGTLRLDPDIDELPRYIMQKHYARKHGSDAYYGQDKRQG